MFDGQFSVPPYSQQSTRLRSLEAKFKVSAIGACEFVFKQNTYLKNDKS